ncbi:uncharacterized protein KQ657_005058 [Scheffersomyces spartinae]|uniref:Uncharacterized protein n=1 Tax=Scheffersomyces spartinae TaxID=45513 RepID=A0A9P8AIN2_9ASCO|nr:uncharacterized protein KQ657_005058 [Scheffersomyces spartinae]KAG7193860.1 hypothetical protein KQ657_005058 [Scheffersomyces spartinae]
MDLPTITSESENKMEFATKYQNSTAATSGTALNVNDVFQSSLSYNTGSTTANSFAPFSQNYLDLSELEGNSFANNDYYDSYNYMFSNVDNDQSSCPSGSHSHELVSNCTSNCTSSANSEFSNSSPLNSPFNSSHPQALKHGSQSNFYQFQGLPSNNLHEFQQIINCMPEAQEVESQFTYSSSSAPSTADTDSFSTSNESPSYPVSGQADSTQNLNDMMNYPDITTFVNSNMHIALPIVESTFVDHRICRVCGKRINRDMSRHMRTHQAISRFTCKFPNQCRHRSGKFNRPYDFKKHLLNRHFKFDDIQIKRKNNLNEKLDHWGTCLCGTRFLAKDWLDYHILTNDKEQRCSYVE